jgi:hypothetical protein
MWQLSTKIVTVAEILILMATKIPRRPDLSF